MKDWAKVTIGIVVILLIGVIAGGKFFSKIEYRETQKVIRDTIYLENYTPYEIEVPVYVTLPTKADTIWELDTVYVAVVVDTLEVVADYSKIKNFKVSLFDNSESGKLTVDALVQYNNLRKISYEYIPAATPILEPKKKLEPYLTANVSTLGVWSAGFGLERSKVGVSLMYVTDMDRSGVGLGINYKF